MRTTLAVASLLALASAAEAAKGFNYGSTFTTGAAKVQSDFEAEFKTAAGLEGTNGFTSARLYTMIQAGTASDVISAIPAALNTGTSLLLGLWGSGGDTAFANEILALKAAIRQHGDNLAKAVDGISIGSEDLYRNSPQGIAAGSNVGANPQTIANYIGQVREAIAGTALSGAKIGHVDTWTAWVNGSNKAVIDACDWIGQDAYPYFEQENQNAIGNNKNLFFQSLAATTGAVGGKPVWITETGFPVSGKTVGQAVPSLENAEAYWQEVGCSIFQTTSVWWYTLQDASPATPDPSFGVIGSTLTTTPLYNLTCGAVSPQGSSSSSSSATLPSSSSSSQNSNGSASATQTGGQASSPSAAATESSSVAVVTGTLSLPDSGGSPQGIPSSQIVLESSTVVTPSVTTTDSQSTAVPTQGSGAVGTVGTGSTTVATSVPTVTPLPTTIPTAGALGRTTFAPSVAFGALLAGIFAGVMI